MAQAFHALMRMVICCGNFLSVVRSNSWPSLMRIVARGSQLPSDLPQITTAGKWPALCLPQPHLFSPLSSPCRYLHFHYSFMYCNYYLNRIRIILIKFYWKQMYFSSFTPHWIVSPLFSTWYSIPTPPCLYFLSPPLSHISIRDLEI